VTGLSDKATTQFVNQAVAPLSARLDAVDTALDDGTNNWNTAYSWGDHAGLYRVIGWVPSWTEVTGKPATFPPETHQHDYTSITNPPWLTEYTETDPVAMAALAGYQSTAYWPPNATASSWFTFTTNANEITITGYNIDGGADVIIPDYINGWPVTTIGANTFRESGVTSIGGAGNVVTVGAFAFDSCASLASVLLPQARTVGFSAFGSCVSLASVLLPQAQTVGDAAFYYCTSLASVPLPQVQTVGVSAFDYCTSLTSVPLPQVQTVGDSAFYHCLSLDSLYFNGNAPTIGANIFADINPNQVTNYVTNPTATGWGATFGGMPVVRLPLYADAIYQAGEPVATTGHVAEQIAAIEFPVASTNYTAWTGTITPANGTATVSIAHGNQPVLVIDAPTVLQLDATGFGTSGVSRVSISYYTGTNALTFATNIIQYAETPTVDTNGWNTLLIRRVSDGAWKGVGL
jgi:hypothetical protein